MMIKNIKIKENDNKLFLQFEATNIDVNNKSQIFIGEGILNLDNVDITNQKISFNLVPNNNDEIFKFVAK